MTCCDLYWTDSRGQGGAKNGQRGPKGATCHLFILQYLKIPILNFPKFAISNSNLTCYNIKERKKGDVMFTETVVTTGFSFIPVKSNLLIVLILTSLHNIEIQGKAENTLTKCTICSFNPGFAIIFMFLSLGSSKIPCWMMVS